MTITDYVYAALKTLGRGTVYEIHALVRKFGVTRLQVSRCIWAGVHDGKHLESSGKVGNREGKGGSAPAVYWLKNPQAWQSLDDLLADVQDGMDEVDEPLEHEPIGPQIAWPSVFHYGSGSSVTLTWNGSHP